MCVCVRGESASSSTPRGPVAVCAERRKELQLRLHGPSGSGRRDLPRVGCARGVGASCSRLGVAPAQRRLRASRGPGPPGAAGGPAAEAASGCCRAGTHPLGARRRRGRWRTGVTGTGAPSLKSVREKPWKLRHSHRRDLKKVGL